MKRTHRRSHFLIWLLLAPAIAGIIYFSVSLRPSQPTNDVLPDALTTEDR